jgi:uncharacterized protein YdaU (DUF1376 family)
MEGAKLDEFIPLHLGWIAKESKDWPSEDVGPILMVIFYLWPKGGRALNDVRKLAKVAGVSPRAWVGIRKTAGDFFREEGDDLVQDFLGDLYAEKSRVYLGNRSKAQKGAAARWGNSRTNAPSNAPSNASGNAPSIAPRYAKSMLRASSCIDLKNSEREEESNARPVPVSSAAVEITEAIDAYPRSRTVSGVTTEVRIGEESARALAAEFLTRNREYPLAWAARYTAKTDKCPRDFSNWIADPPAAERVLAFYHAALRDKREKRAAVEGESLKSDPAQLRAMVEEITTNAGKGLTHA